MIIGDFDIDLEQFLLENKGRTKSSKSSTAALKTVGILGKGTLEQGRMYSFRYFTEDETFYDSYPIVVGLGQGQSNNQMGINLHYIPYDVRISLLKDIIKSFRNFFNMQLNFAGNVQNQKYISEFTYDAVKKSLGRKYNLKYAIRQYRMDRMKDIRILGYEDWYLGAVNDDNYFIGGTIADAQKLYYKYIK